MPVVKSDIHSKTEARFELEPAIVDFARAFRSAATAVGMYPRAHPAVQSSLQPLVNAIAGATARGPVCFTVLPATVLVDGASLQPDTALADLAGRLHRHGIGAMRLNGSATADAWHAFLDLMARPAEDVRASGGVQKQWAASGHAHPVILEIDFGDLLRGRVGGDVNELSGVINHYLEGGGAPAAMPEAALQALLAALETPEDPSAPHPASAAAMTAAEQVRAILRVLRSAAQLTLLPESGRLEETFRRAAEIGGRLDVPVMAGLLALRGTPEALIGTVDVVATFIDGMTTDTLARFLARAVAAGHGRSQLLAETFAALVPDPPGRREAIAAAQSMAAEGLPAAPVEEMWADVERSLDGHADPRYVSDEYARELEAARLQAVALSPSPDESPDVVPIWIASIADEPVRRLDLRLLEDLIELQTDQTQWRNLLASLAGSIGEAIASGDWTAAADNVEVMARAAGDASHPLRQPFAAEALDKLAKGPAGRRAIACLSIDREQLLDPLMRFLSALGPTLVPALVDARCATSDPAVHGRLESILAGHGARAGESLRRLCASADWQTRRAAAVLVERLGVSSALPAVGALLGDPQAEVRSAAVRALAASASEKGAEILAHHLSRADAAVQAALLEELTGLDRANVQAVLRKLVELLDQRTADKGVYLWVISAIARTPTGESVTALALVVRARHWTAPLRGRLFGIAAVSGLGAIGSPAAIEALLDAARTRAWGVASHARRELARLATRQTSASR